MRILSGRDLIVATHNDGKLREIADLIAPFGFKTQSAGALGLAEPEETGTTFEENAYIKALSAAQLTELPALSDDSGLCVDALDGAPGVYTADWATQADGHRDFVKAMQKVEDEMRARGAIKANQRGGRFISVLCLAWPDGHAEYFRGEVEGTMVWPPLGQDGFGFDPMFLPKGYQKTFGEMSAEEKHSWKPGDKQALSHRARAFKLFAETLLAKT
ncbi:RdgB/HAM1 family non-canonical purine NTP pyrophosphatase [Bartonella tamiae]|uniref:dITP/XTP pyrophosphatase n=1 Tax=Bartonella tamiae Th239 TaxID=1094558 RepID=J0ZQV1_9HYPH|nr:RdgB/HAM1 family non-canonical purine NTP pyrophosphatase [Bartonella tamiae]EJF91053.1 nucleoside-triphosphatase [Bartonella tamiae Th239]EJF93282.1 nucleoside-triphosphatase [Bartonella tamiae Th307]